jgi:release factor glutamine methyltransferase
MRLAVTIEESLKQANQILSAISATPVLDAEVLLAHVLGKSRSYLLAASRDELTSVAHNQFTALITRRLQREPVAYLTGEKEFWSLNFEVNPGTLIPRPETELLVEAVLELFPEKNQSLRVADLGTGSGAIALALASERPLWDIYAVDNSDIALGTARKNAQRFGLNSVSFCFGNWFTALPAGDLDLVVSNPPYISEQEWPSCADDLLFEPRTALLAKQYIRHGGYLMVEHGCAQGFSVRKLFITAGCINVRTIVDLSGRERVTVGQF